MKSMVALLVVVAVVGAEYAGSWNKKWYGPLALPPGYDQNGAPLPVQDTPEVSAARAAQLAALTRAGGHAVPNTWPSGSTQPQDWGQWNNPLWNVHARPAGV